METLKLIMVGQGCKRKKSGNWYNGGKSVNGRRSSFVKPDIAQSRAFDGEDQSQVATYYLSNFGNEIDAKYLFSILGYYGELQEVVIPEKRNQLGRRFGFARFHRVQDPEHFVIKLDNVFVGGEKLFANLSRFQCEPNQWREMNVPKEKEVVKGKEVGKGKEVVKIPSRISKYGNRRRRGSLVKRRIEILWRVKMRI